MPERRLSNNYFPYKAYPTLPVRRNAVGTSALPLGVILNSKITNKQHQNAPKMTAKITNKKAQKCQKTNKQTNKKTNHGTTQTAKRTLGYSMDFVRFTLSWECTHRVTQAITASSLSTNDHEHAASVDCGITNQFQPVGEFANHEG